MFILEAIAKGLVYLETHASLCKNTDNIAKAELYQSRMVKKIPARCQVIIYEYFQKQPGRQRRGRWGQELNGIDDNHSPVNYSLELNLQNTSCFPLL